MLPRTVFQNFLASELMLTICFLLLSFHIFPSNSYKATSPSAHLIFMSHHDPGRSLESDISLVLISNITHLSQLKIPKSLLLWCQENRSATDSALNLKVPSVATHHHFIFSYKVQVKKK